ncbi:MAG: hypothetical protein ABIR96_07125 [Bdellovibrionota bacterium]
MIRVYKTSGFSMLWLVLGLAVLIVVGLPVLLAATAVFAILNLGFAFLRGPSAQQARAAWNDPNLSAVIDNKEIGPYRIKQNEADPSVIEVLDS